MELPVRRHLLIIVLFITIILAINPLTVSTVIAAESDKQSQASGTGTEKGVQVKNPASDLWRAVRQREFSGSHDFKATTQVKRLDGESLINVEGNKWRELRREKILPYSSYFIIGVVGFLILLTILIRQVKVPNGRSGKAIVRMSVMQRISHWFMALLVIFMAVSGLLILFGRMAIIPYVGAEAFSPVASFSIEGHNLLGPVMIFSLLLMLVYFIRHNLPALGDFKWVFSAGGLFTKKHLEIGFFNAGEKILYWITILLGIVLSVTGLLLLFPEYQEQVNLNSQFALIIHAIAALMLTALALAHIWMVRTIEGTLEAITKGKVDENWAKAHHSIWHKKVTQKK